MVKLNAYNRIAATLLVLAVAFTHQMQRNGPADLASENAAIAASHSLNGNDATSFGMIFSADFDQLLAVTFGRELIEPCGLSSSTTSGRSFRSNPLPERNLPYVSSKDWAALRSTGLESKVVNELIL